MKNSTIMVTLLGCVSFALVPARTDAKNVFCDSIEWVLATSDRVVVGKVVKADKVTGSDKKECDLITVAVSKTLKGEHADEATFLVPNYASGYAKQWMDEGHPILFCLVKNDGQRVPVPAEKFPWVVRRNIIGIDAFLLGKSKQTWTGCMPVLTRGFEVLTEPDAILKYVEQTVKAAPKDSPPRSHKVQVPSYTAVYDRLWSRSAVFLYVPIDEKLEALGQTWYKSERPGERREAASMLRYFKTEKNVEILKSLLNDPSTSESTEKKFYFVRQAAFDALTDWNVKVDRPILEEPLKR